MGGIIRRIETSALGGRLHTDLAHPRILIEPRQIRAAHGAILVQKLARPVNLTIVVQGLGPLQVSDPFVDAMLFLMQKRQIEPRRRIPGVKLDRETELLRRMQGIARQREALPQVASKHGALRLAGGRHHEGLKPAGIVAHPERHQATAQPSIAESPVRIDGLVEAPQRSLVASPGGEEEAVERDRRCVLRGERQGLPEGFRRLRSSAKTKLHLGETRPGEPELGGPCDGVPRRSPSRLQMAARLLVVGEGHQFRGARGRRPRCWGPFHRLNRVDEALQRTRRRRIGLGNQTPRPVDLPHAEEQRGPVGGFGGRKTIPAPRVGIDRHEQVAAPIGAQGVLEGCGLLDRQAELGGVNHRRVIQIPLDQRAGRFQDGGFGGRTPQERRPALPAAQDDLTLRVLQRHLAIEDDEFGIAGVVHLHQEVGPSDGSRGAVWKPELRPLGWLPVKDFENAPFEQRFRTRGDFQLREFALLNGDTGAEINLRATALPRAESVSALEDLTHARLHPRLRASFAVLDLALHHHEAARQRQRIGALSPARLFKGEEQTKCEQKGIEPKPGAMQEVTRENHVSAR